MAHLTPEQKAAIINLMEADPHANAASLCRQLGLHRSTVSQLMGRLRKAGGWYTPIEYGICVHCGQPMVIPVGKNRTTHKQCKRGRGDSLAKVRWQESSEEKREKRRSWWRERNNRMYAEVAEEKKRESLARLRDHTSAQQDASLPTAIKRGAPWTEEERQYLMTNWGRPPMEYALALGRTLYSVKMEIHRIRKVEGLEK